MTERDVFESDGARDGVVQLSPEAQQAAARAAAAAGMSVSEWLTQLIKYAGTMAERRRADAPAGEAPAGEAKAAPEPPRTVPVMVPISALRPNRASTDGGEDEHAIQTCLGAYRETGNFPPITVRRIESTMGDGASLEIVSGEQRWRAAVRAQLREVPVIIQNCTDQEAVLFAIREAKRRYKLGPVTEARNYLRLMKSYGMAAEDIARAVGESADQVIDTVHLMSLPVAVQKMVEEGVLSRIHARALLHADDPEAIAWEVAGRGLDIFQTEQLVRNAKAGPGGADADDGPRS